MCVYVDAQPEQVCICVYGVPCSVCVCICMSVPVCACPHLVLPRNKQRTEQMMSREAGDMFLCWCPIQGKDKDMVPASQL